jgi:hypothetical protein
MNTNLEKVFNLDPHRPVTEPETTPEQSEASARDLIESTVENLDKIDAALPLVLGLEASEREMDDLAKMATDGYQQLMDLGMNVEIKNASEIFNAAGNLLGHALSAKTAKINKKLKMIELQLKKKQLDLKEKLSEQSESDNTIAMGSATVLDRNTLLAEILNKKSPTG